MKRRNTSSTLVLELKTFYLSSEVSFASNVLWLADGQKSCFWKPTFPVCVFGVCCLYWQKCFLYRQGRFPLLSYEDETVCDKLGKNDIKRKFYKTVQMRTKTVF